MNFLQFFCSSPEPSWISRPGVRSELEKAILADDREAILQIIRSNSPDPMEERLFGVMTRTNERMSGILVDKTGKRLGKDYLILANMPMNILNVELTAEGLKAIIGDDIYIVPIAKLR